MNELFRLKIASKRQMTAPQRLLELLGLGEGDEIQIEVTDGQIVDVHPCKAVPTKMLSTDLLSKIKEREERLVQGQGKTIGEALQEVKNLKTIKAMTKQFATKADSDKEVARRALPKK